MAKPDVKRRKLDTENISSDEDDVRIASDRLTAYGEQFMSMFEDYEPTKQKRPSSKAKTVAAVDTDSDALSLTDDDDDRDLSDGELDAEDSSSSDEELDAIFKTKGSGSKQPGTKGKRIAKPISAAAAPPPPLSGKKLNPSTDVVAAALQMKLERKRFMSHKASNITDGPSMDPGLYKAKQKKVDDGQGLSHAEFLEMQREVQLYGASALDKRSKKKFDAALLAKLGSKPQKGPRISASIGLGMAKKQALREKKAEAEAFAAGMGKPKTRKQKDRAERRAGGGRSDKGLLEDGGAFRKGVFNVKKLTKGGSGGGYKKGRR